jgi:hypothetical protein
LLGTLQAGPAADMVEVRRRQIAGRLRMAAEAAHVRHVALMPASSHVDLRALAKRLDAAPSGTTAGAQAAMAASGWPAGGPEAVVQVVEMPSAEIPIHASGMENPALSNGGAMGLVIVVPDVVKKADLADARHLLRASPAPLLGLLTYPSTAARTRRRPR